MVGLMGDIDVHTLTEDVEAATGGLVAAVSKLDDAGVHAPSALPGWTRGHVLTHVARSADSMTNLLDWARTGVEIPQYAGAEAREAGITEGAPRGAAEQLADLRATADRFTATARALPTDAWGVMVRSFNGDEHAAWFTLVRRWCEVEIHHVDLDTGYTTADWPDGFAAHVLRYTAHRWTARGIAPVAILRDITTETEWRFAASDPASSVAGPGPALAAWAVGRSPGTGLTSTPGPVPTAPSWP